MALEGQDVARFTVHYRADGWTRPLAAIKQREELQTVTQDLPNSADGVQRRLYVELARVPGSPVVVIEARVERNSTDRYGRPRWQSELLLGRYDLELVEDDA